MTKSKNNKTSTGKITVNKSKILEQLMPLIEESARELDLTVLDVTFNKEHGKYFLRVFIYSSDKPITHAECSDLTRSLSNKMDDSNLLEIPYALEVSSPGVNRKLKNPIEFEVFKGKMVRITLKKTEKSEEKSNVVTGELLALTEDEENVLIIIEETTKSFKLSNIKTIQLEG